MGEIVSGVAITLSEKLATKAYQEIASVCGLKGDVEKLQASMRLISAYLMDAENKQVNDLRIIEWLRQLKEAFFDASDILDEIECETLQNKVVKEYGSATRKVCQFFSYSNPIAFRIKMSHKIRDLRERIKEITFIRESFGLVIDHHNNNDRSLIQKFPWRETYPDLPSRVIGRDQEKEKVINDLMRPNLEDNKIDVIPIVGLGGLGKTTLAQLVYNDKRIVENFQVRMWVCVSDVFEFKRLMLEILKAAGKDVQSFNLDCLHETLHGKKFLLVLDDIWNEDVIKWRQIEDVLLGLVDEGNKKDSKIIVTTRSHNVASIMENVPRHKLEALPEKECLELFFKYAFQKGEAKKHPRLKKIGKEIVEKCKGVPLAVVTLGGWLYSRYDEFEWMKIRDSELLKKDGILHVLELSYNQLPPQVKQCFSFCSIFPKDYVHDNVELISFWMAHGLLQSVNDKEEPENVGELYIKILLGISFFLPNDEEIYDPAKKAFGFFTFKMHDLVHDLALTMMRRHLDEKVRHLLLPVDDASLFAGQKLNKVQTIMLRNGNGTFVPAESVNWICNELKYLKVFDCFVGFDVQFLPDRLGKMKHLRCLHLVVLSKMKKLPNSICKLQNLQYLELFGLELEELPKNMGRNLVSLRAFKFKVNVPNLSSIDIGCFKCLQLLVIQFCPNLVSLPQDLRNITSLKKLYVWGCPKLVAFEDDELENEIDMISNFSLQVFGICELPKLRALPNWLTRFAKKSLHTIDVKSCHLYQQT